MICSWRPGCSLLPAISLMETVWWGGFFIKRHTAANSILESASEYSPHLGPCAWHDYFGQVEEFCISQSVLEFKANNLEGSMDGVVYGALSRLYSPLWNTKQKLRHTYPSCYPLKHLSRYEHLQVLCLPGWHGCMKYISHKPLWGSLS